MFTTTLFFMTTLFLTKNPNKNPNINPTRINFIFLKNI